jgi:hypothetical protein
VRFSFFVLCWFVSAVLGSLGPVYGKTCKKGKKPCGGRCISERKACKDDDDAPAAPAGTPANGTSAGAAANGAASNDHPIESASSALVTAAFASPAGKAMVQLARTLRQSGDLDVDDASRAVFQKALRGARPPLVICSISHIQLVRECEPLVGGNVTLPCYLAVDEMSDACKAMGTIMPQFK